MKYFYLIRHCQATGQDADAPLTELGEQQAEQLADFLSEYQIQEIVSSSYIRAVDSVRPLSAVQQLPILIEERLCERVLSAVPLDDWMERLAQSYDDDDLTLPGGESAKMATARGMGVIDDWRQRPAQRIALVTHGNLLSLMLRHYDQSFGFEQWRKLSNPDVYELCIPSSGEFGQSETGKAQWRRVWS